MRTAEEQFAVAGVSAFIRGLCIERGGLWISGKGGDCLMLQDEWDRFYQLREKWLAAPLDLHNAPGISMLEATAEEEAELERLTRRPRSFFADSFREIEKLILSHTHALSEDERDEIVLQIGIKILPLRESVLRAEEIWNEPGTIRQWDNETMRQGELMTGGDAA